MYWCDCDNTRGKFVDGLSSEIIDGSASAISDCYPECIHISAVRDIVEEEVDTVFGLSADDEFAGKFEDSRLHGPLDISVVLLQITPMLDILHHHQL